MLLRVLLLFTCLSGGLQLAAQQLGTFAVYRDNFQLINPAAMNHFYIASDGQERHNFLFNGSVRQQWAGAKVEGAPLSANVRFEHAPADMSMKYGLFLTHDEIFVTNQQSVRGNYAYFIDLSRRGRNLKRLSIGLNAGLIMQRVDTDPDRLFFADPLDDPSAYIAPNRLYADFALGAFYLGVVPGRYRLYGGLSMLQAFPLHVSGERPGDNGIRAEDLVPHYYFLAGSVVNLTNWTFIEPSVWMRYTPDVRYYSLGNFSVPVSMNLNVRYQMLQRRFTQKRRIHGFWIGLGGATSREVMVEAGGLMIQEQDKIYKLGLAYSFQLSSVVQLGPTLELNGSFSL